MRTQFRLHLLATTLLVAASAAPAVAQDATGTVGQPTPAQSDANAPQPDAADTGETIIVTGSRIANPSATSASPLQIVGAEQIQQAGVTNIQDVLLENPVFGTPGISRTNSSFATQSAGVATVDLRNLGSDRTLTLVNGRRFVAGVPGSSTVDLNVIPTLFLERVDVLTGGASAVYGSDAVAGVVNFIYKTKFDGIEVDGQAGITDRGDGSDRQINVLVGKNFADGRGNVMLFGGYSKQGTVLKRDRSTEAGPSDIDSTSDELAQNTRVGPFFSGFTPRGRYYTDNYTFTYDPITNALRPCTSTNGGTCNAPGTPFDGTAIGPDGFNRSDFRYLAVPVERYVAAGRGNFEFSPAFNVFVEGNFARTRASTVIEPFPFDSSYVTADGQVPIESLVNGVLYRNPYVPDAIFNDSSDTNGDGLRDIFFDKRLTDFGGRTSTAERDLFRVAGGVNGKFGANEQFNYEVYGIYGQTVENQTGNGQFDSRRFTQALNAIRDVNDVNGNGNRTEIICADAAARAAGCIPANPFGVGSLAPAVSYLAVPTTLRSKVTQTVAGGNVSGNLFSLFGADPIGVSIGGEYRRESSSNDFDLLTQQGLNGGNALPSTRGSFDLYEGFAEAIVPILQDKPFFQSFSLRGAVRVSDYSTVGQTFSYNYGGEWSPVDGIRFRVIKARSVRAPNVNELFQPPQQDFPTGLQDPCAGITATTAGTLATNCRAAPGVNANIAANGGVFTVSQADLQGITSFGGGNVNLQEEKGDSFTAGVVINPRSLGFLRNFTLTVDYFNIRIKDAIVSTPLQFILDQCYNQSNTALCSLVVRRAAIQGANSAGSLDQVNTSPTNSGGLRTSGIDTVVTWSSGLDAIGLPGKLGVKASYTHLISGVVTPLVGQPDQDYFAGEVGAARDRFTANVGWDTEDVGVNVTGTYIGVSYLDDQLTGARAGNPAYRVSPQFYLDTQIRFKVAPRFEFYVGADNLLDNKPPYLADIGASAGQDTDAGTYDVLGRRYYAGARVKF
jgi:iron complex outermembrane recepter protein